ncbi:MAG: zinc ribbon domain-containing protein [Candidatus Baldrarchaeia archaeon]
MKHLNYENENFGIKCPKCGELIIFKCWNCGNYFYVKDAELCKFCNWYICPECKECGCGYYVTVKKKDSYLLQRAFKIIKKYETKCWNCGKPVEKDANFCSWCGAPTVHTTWNPDFLPFPEVIKWAIKVKQRYEGKDWSKILRRTSRMGLEKRVNYF